MNHNDLYRRIARSEFIERYMDSASVSGIIDSFSGLSPIIRTIWRDDDNGSSYQKASSSLRTGIDLGVRAYVSDIARKHQDPTAKQTIDHLANQGEFSEALFSMITKDPAIAHPHIDPASGTYAQSLIDISELSGIIAEDFYRFVDTNYIDGMRRERFF